MDRKAYIKNGHLYMINEKKRIAINMGHNGYKSPQDYGFNFIIENMSHRHSTSILEIKENYEETELPEWFSLIVN